jgi:hypothetical protein
MAVLAFLNSNIFISQVGYAVRTFPCRENEAKVRCAYRMPDILWIWVLRGMGKGTHSVPYSFG